MVRPLWERVKKYPFLAYDKALTGKREGKREGKKGREEGKRREGLIFFPRKRGREKKFKLGRRKGKGKGTC